MFRLQYVSVHLGVKYQLECICPKQLLIFLLLLVETLRKDVIIKLISAITIHLVNSFDCSFLTDSNLSSILQIDDQNFHIISRSLINNYWFTRFFPIGNCSDWH